LTVRSPLYALRAMMWGERCAVFGGDQHGGDQHGGGASGGSGDRSHRRGV